MADLREVFQKYGGDYETTMARFMGKLGQALQAAALLELLK